MTRITLLLLALVVLFVGVFANASPTCRDERTIGATYLQAKTNCEAILKGEAHDCNYGGSIYYCKCEIGCQEQPTGQSGNFTRTLGASYLQARTNCEVILRGEAGRCEYGGNGNWYCDCAF